MSRVGLTRSSYKDIFRDIGRAIERGDGLPLSDGDHVAIKINLCDFRMPETGAITHPVFLDALLGYLKGSYKRVKISVVESDATVARPDLLIKWFGFTSIFDKHDVSWTNLSRDKKTRRTLGGRYFKEIEVPNTISDSDCFISLAKLKTSLPTKISCSLKNQFGCVPEPNKIRFHDKLDDAIVDANLAMRPDYCIVDGILAMGGTKGPDLGVPIRAGVLFTGGDPVSVDSACARFMHFHPYFIGHIRKASASGVGTMSYELVGDDASDCERDFDFNPLYASILRFVMSMK